MSNGNNSDISKISEVKVYSEKNDSKTSFRDYGNQQSSSNRTGIEIVSFDENGNEVCPGVQTNIVDDMKRSRTGHIDRSVILNCRVYDSLQNVQDNNEISPDSVRWEWMSDSLEYTVQDDGETVLISDHGVPLIWTTISDIQANIDSNYGSTNAATTSTSSASANTDEHISTVEDENINSSSASANANENSATAEAEGSDSSSASANTDEHISTVEDENINSSTTTSGSYNNWDNTFTSANARSSYEQGDIRSGDFQYSFFDYATGWHIDLVSDKERSLLYRYKTYNGADVFVKYYFEGTEFRNDNVVRTEIIYDNGTIVTENAPLVFNDYGVVPDDSALIERMVDGYNSFAADYPESSPQGRGFEFQYANYDYYNFYNELWLRRWF